MKEPTLVLKIQPSHRAFLAQDLLSIQSTVACQEHAQLATQSNARDSGEGRARPRCKSWCPSPALFGRGSRMRLTIPTDVDPTTTSLPRTCATQTRTSSRGPRRLCNNNITYWKRAQTAKSRDPAWRGGGKWGAQLPPLIHQDLASQEDLPALYNANAPTPSRTPHSFPIR